MMRFFFAFVLTLWAGAALAEGPTTGDYWAAFFAVTKAQDEVSERTTTHQEDDIIRTTPNGLSGVPREYQIPEKFFCEADEAAQDIWACTFMSRWRAGTSIEEMLASDFKETRYVNVLRATADGYVIDIELTQKLLYP